MYHFVANSLLFPKHEVILNDFVRRCAASSYIDFLLDIYGKNRNGKEKINLWFSIFEWRVLLFD